MKQDSSVLVKHLGPLSPFIRRAETTRQINLCFPAMRELRPHLQDKTFARLVNRQRSQGYHLVYRLEGGIAVSVAGYRIGENLSRGRFLYVDDFVTGSLHRNQGFGTELFRWLVEESRREECPSIHLDSGLTRTEAHRFYEGLQLKNVAYHYSLVLPPSEG